MGMVQVGGGSRHYQVRDWLRDLGGKYDAALGQWLLPEENAAEAMRIISDRSIGPKPATRAPAASLAEPEPLFIPMEEDDEDESFSLMPSMPPAALARAGAEAKPKKLIPQLDRLPFRPTDEQMALITAYGETEGDLISGAAAGSGKTTELILVALAYPSVRFLYLCFNRKNADEAKGKFPPNVQVMTAHSLAFRYLGLGRHQHKLNMGKYDFSRLFKQIFDTTGDPLMVPGVSDKQYVDLLREAVKHFESSMDEKVAVKPDGRIAKLVAAAFILSQKGVDGLKADAEKVVALYEEKHPSIKDRYPEMLATLETIERDRRRNVLSTIRSIDPTALKVLVAYYQSELLSEKLGRFLRQLQEHADAFFGLQADLDSTVPFEHSTYLKMYQLSHPEVRGFDAILFDEAQDANPVILDIVQRQKMRKVYVGDQHQSIYEFTGAVNTIETLIEQGIPLLPLTQSFRFGQNVADLANRVLALKYRYQKWKFKSGSIPLLTGIGGGKAEGPSAILCRSNVGVLQEALANIRADIYFADCLPYTYLASMLDIYRLKMEQPITNRESQYFGFDSIGDLKHEADLRGDVDTMRAISLLEKMGAEKFRDAVESLMVIAKEARKTAAIHILTAHKAKGLEWATVKLSDDFASRFVEKDGRLRKEVPEQEINLLYVAVTRAMNTVSLPPALADILENF